MRKINKLGYIAIGMVIAIIISTATPAFSAATKDVAKQLKAYFTSGGKPISVYVNGTKVAKDSKGKAITPFIVDGTVYVPANAIADALGKSVTWDRTTASVKITDKTTPASPTSDAKDINKITTTKDAKGGLHDSIENFSFVSDKDVIGKWETIDFVETPDQFDSTDLSRREYVWPNTYSFNGDGMVTMSSVNANGVKESMKYKWTKGYVLLGEDAVSSYEIKQSNGKTLMFMEWKTGDYTIRGQKPCYYVFMKTSNTPDSNSNSVSNATSFKYKGIDVNLPGSIKDENAKLTTTINANAERHDKLDYTFTLDKAAVGEWQFFNYYDVDKIAGQFNPNDTPYLPLTGDMHYSIYNNGSMSLSNMDSGKRIYRADIHWTKGYFMGIMFNSDVVPAYALTNINGKTFMIMEWKSGDYIKNNTIKYYYVFVKTSDTPSPTPDEYK